MHALLRHSSLRRLGSGRIVFSIAPYPDRRRSHSSGTQLASIGRMTSPGELLDASWQSLDCPSSELRLEFTLPTGQSFRWRKTGPQEYTGVIQQRVVSSPLFLSFPPYFSLLSVSFKIFFLALLMVLGICTAVQLSAPNQPSLLHGTEPVPAPCAGADAAGGRRCPVQSAGEG